jgi:hypothetical protein
MDRFDEDDDLTYERRVIDNQPFVHPDLPGWAYKPADGRVQQRPELHGGTAEWRHEHPSGGTIYSEGDTMSRCGRTVHHGEGESE